MKIVERIIGSSIDTIVSGMNVKHPESKFSNSKSYQAIVKEYLDRCILELLNNITEDNTIPEVSISKIRSGFNYRYNKNQYWWNYLYNNYPLWIEIQKGYNVSESNRQLTKIKCLVDLDDLLHYRMNTDFSEYLRSDTDLTGDLTKTQLDLKSLKTAQKVFAQEEQYQNVILCQNLLDQNVNGYMINNAEIKRNVFGLGRMYMKGANNMQGMKKSVREAALGKCYRYDIKSSVFAYMMHVIKTDYPDRKVPHMTELLDHKQYIRKTLATDCLTHTQTTPEHKLKLIKQSLTALSFGSNPKSWHSGIAEYIYSESDRDRFAQHPFVQGLLKEIREYQEIIRTLFPKSEYPGVKLATLCSNHYQSMESYAIRKIITDTATDPLIVVHDCIYTQKPIDSVYATVILQDCLGDYAKFECKKISAWYDKTIRNESIVAENWHRYRIRQEEKQAQNYEMQTYR